MSGTTLQQVVNHQSLNFHLPCNVQVGEHNIQNQLTNQLQEDNDRMKEQIQQLQSDKQSQADLIQSQAGEIEQLKLRVKVLEDKTDTITLDIYHGFGEYAITICVCRCSSVSEVEKVIQKEIKRKYGTEVVGYIECICGLVNRGNILYQRKNDKDRPLKHYGVQCGDEALWYC